MGAYGRKGADGVSGQVDGQRSGQTDRRTSRRGRTVGGQVDERSEAD